MSPETPPTVIPCNPPRGRPPAKDPLTLWTRTVFGRRQFFHQGKIHVIEMRADGIVIWPKGSRKKRTATFADILEATAGQKFLL